MSKKIILFIGATLYSSLPQFFSIVHELKDFHKILLSVNDPTTVRFDSTSIDKEIINKHFDLFLDLPKYDFKKKYFWISHLEYKKLMLKYLKKINPTAVLSCSDMLLSQRIIFYWCKRNKIPFIIIQPSFIEGAHFKKFGFKDYARYIIVNKLLRIPIYRRQQYWGYESQKSQLFLWSNFFLKNKKRKKVYFIGNPAFDNLFKNFNPHREIKNKIVICTQYIDVLFGNNIANKVNNFYLEAINSKPEITFYIKLHPREEKNKYHHIFNQKRYHNIKIVKDMNLYDLFEICDIQMSVASFTSFEATAKGLPIIIVNPNNQIKIPDYFQEEIGIKVTKIDKICEAIEQTLTGEYWQEFLSKRVLYFEKTLLSTDGKSSMRAANQIRKIIESKR